MISKYKVKVCSMVEAAKGKLSMETIPFISLYNIFRFAETSIRCWKAYNIGEGLFSLTIRNLKIVNMGIGK